MGQTLSAPQSAQPADGWPPPATELSPLPADLPPFSTSIVTLGDISEDNPPVWHVQGGRLRFPIPAGFQASCIAYDRKAHLFVERNGPHSCKYVVKTEDGDTYEGSTPTAPLAKWALVLQRLDVANGLEAFGLTHPKVQSLLRALGATTTGLVDSPVSQLAPGAAVGAWARGELPPQGPPLIQQIEYGAQNAQRAASLAPSLHNWLSVPISVETAAPKSPSKAMEIPSQKVLGREIPVPPPPPPPPTTTTAATPFAVYPRGLPPLPPTLHSTAIGTAPTPQEHALELMTRPGSRARRSRPGSSADAAGGQTGRGWTAFTAFGIDVRDGIKAMNPHASSVEIEKMVGKQWAALTSEQKQHYVDVAAKARRSSQGNLIALAPSGSLEGLGLSEIESLKRARSDAAAMHEERQLRTRKPRTFGLEYDVSVEVLPGGGGGGLGGIGGRRGSLGKAASMDREIDKMFATAGGGVEGAAGEEMALAAAAVPQKKKRGKGRGGIMTKKAEAEAEDEVLGLLADMRAEVLASESEEKIKEKFAEGASTKSVGAGGDGDGDQQEVHSLAR